ncbi:hypothetical protein P885DRAFT_79693 [Corynascus similis CBS 632.67]
MERRGAIAGGYGGLAGCGARDVTEEGLRRLVPARRSLVAQPSLTWIFLAYFSLALVKDEAFENSIMLLKAMMRDMWASAAALFTVILRRALSSP